MGNFHGASEKEPSYSGDNNNYNIRIDRVSNGWVLYSGNVSIVVQHDGSDNLECLVFAIEKMIITNEGFK